MSTSLKDMAKFMAGEHETYTSENALRVRKLAIIGGIIGIALLASFMIHAWGSEDTMDYPANLSPDITNAIDESIDWTIVNLDWFFDGISDNLKIALGKLRDFLVWIPWPVVVALIFLTGWKAASLRIGIASGLGMAAIGFVNLWEP
ncbi:MAG: hypothetical protein H8E48_01500, partial [Chloroflexi bacterium]|nr:hypothetical protein [Chloroflexota bacterium]